MVTTFERRIELTGCFNFRDVGGYRTADGRMVRWRRLFRSDGLHRLTPDDVARLSGFGLTTVIDLRTVDELNQTGLSPLHGGGSVVHRHIPFVAAVGNPAEGLGADLGQLYLRMLDGAAVCVGEVVSLLTEAEHYPVVVHCAGGKDRTGMTVAIVLRALGVGDAEIVADYALTDGYLAERREEFLARPEASAYGKIDPALLRALPATMTQTLAVLDERYGSTVGFLGRCGVTESQIERLRQQLLVSA